MLRIDRLLREAECIDIYATGISYTLAQAAAFKFATLGVESSAYESINGHYLAARKHKKTVAFVISFTGPTARWKPWPNTCAPPPTTMWWASWAPTIR